MLKGDPVDSLVAGLGQAWLMAAVGAILSPQTLTFPAPLSQQLSLSTMQFPPPHTLFFFPEPDVGMRPAVGGGFLLLAQPPSSLTSGSSLTGLRTGPSGNLEISGSSLPTANVLTMSLLSHFLICWVTAVPLSPLAIISGLSLLFSLFPSGPICIIVPFSVSHFWLGWGAASPL